MHKNDYVSYPYRICEKAIWVVFDDLKFRDKETKTILRDSYLLNLAQMVDFARKNHIDELDYLLGIRDVLIKSGTARER